MARGLFSSGPETLDHTFDDKGRVYQVISPDTGTTTYQYDPAGNLTSKTDAKGVTISYQYDALNRLTKIDFPTDTDIVYAYDSCVNGKGRLCMTDASGTTSYEYWPKGQVKKENICNCFLLRRLYPELLQLSVQRGKVDPQLAGC